MWLGSSPPRSFLLVLALFVSAWLHSQTIFTLDLCLCSSSLYRFIFPSTLISVIIAMPLSPCFISPNAKTHPSSLLCFFTIKCTSSSTGDLCLILTDLKKGHPTVFLCSIPLRETAVENDVKLTWIILPFGVRDRGYLFDWQEGAMAGLETTEHEAAVLERAHIAVWHCLFVVELCITHIAHKICSVCNVLKCLLHAFKQYQI